MNETQPVNQHFSPALGGRSILWRERTSVPRAMGRDTDDPTAQGRTVLMALQRGPLALHEEE